MKTPLLLVLLLISVIAKSQTDNSLSFDNVDDYVTVPGASGLIANSTQISLSCWVYPEHNVSAFPDYDGFCGFRNNTDADFYMIQIPGDLVEARFRNSAGLNFDVIDSGLQLNVWQHYVLTYDGTELTLYRNGVISGSTTASGTIANTLDSLFIGNLNYLGTDFFMMGELDEVSVWNKSLSSSEVRCIYESYIDSTSIGLMLYYKFNQGVAAGINIGVNSLLPATGSIQGSMHNFALSGNTSNWVTGIENYTQLSDVICPGQVYTFGSQLLTLPGIYFETSTGGSGCDSIVRLILSSVANDSVTVSGNHLHCAQVGGTYQWIDCDNGHAPISGANNQDYFPTVTGNYAVIVTFNGCTDTSYCYDLILGGINDLSKEEINVFPNPSSDKISFPDKYSGSEILIYDSFGKMTERIILDRNELSVEDLSKGIYLFKLIEKNGVYSGTFIRN